MACRVLVVLGLVLGLACGPAAPAARAPAAPAAGPITRVILVSVDGLLPAAYLSPDEHGLKVPTLRELARDGAVSPGARSVFPSVTYPAHTTMVTGVAPARHGIVTNQAFDPRERNQGGWRWYAEDIAATTLWDAARARGLRTALVDWPVTVGAAADAVIPDFWRAGQPDDLKLLRAVSTPGLIDAIGRRFADYRGKLGIAAHKDAGAADAAVHLLATAPPELLLLHLEGVDHFQHGDGLWGHAARTAIEEADRQLARVIAAARAAGVWEQTALVLVSDHGFRTVARDLRPGALLRERGLVELDRAGQVARWDAVAHVSGGHAYIYLRDSADPAAAAGARAALTGPDGAPVAGIGRIWDQAGIRARGGDPTAFLALEAADMYGLVGGHAGAAIGPAHAAATHGWDPEHPDMLAALIVYGPAVAPGRLDGARLLDVAPTIAAWLGLALPAAEGRPLAITLR